MLRLDASFPLGLPEEYGIYGGVFADVGSLWGLDDTDGSMGEVDAGMHMRSSVGVSLFVDTPFAPLRFNYAVPLAVRGLRRARAVPLPDPDPVLSRAPRGRGCRRSLALALAARRGAGPVGRPAAAAAPPFLIINQEQHPDRLAGRPGSCSPTRSASATRCAAEARALDAAFEAEEQRLTEQRPDLDAGGVPQAVATPSTRAWCRRGATRTSARSALAQEFDQRRRQFYARVAPILVTLMDRYGAKAIFDENSVLLADQSLNITDGGHRRDRRRRPRRRRAGPGAQADRRRHRRRAAGATDDGGN